MISRNAFNALLRSSAATMRLKTLNLQDLGAIDSPSRIGGAAEDQNPRSRGDGVTKLLCSHDEVVLDGCLDDLGLSACQLHNARVAGPVWGRNKDLKRQHPVALNLHLWRLLVKLLSKDQTRI